MRARGFFGVLSNDLPTKGVALAGALFLWAGVTFLGSRTVTLENVPVSLVNLPHDLGVSDGITPVTVRVRVPRTLASDTDLVSLVRAFVDLGGSGLGERNVLVTVTPTDPRVDILAITPVSLRVTLDPIVERTVSVRVTPTGTPQEGYRIGDVGAKPERVNVRAALGILERLSGIDAPITVEGATAAIDADVPLTVPEGTQVTPTRVRVTVAIEQAEGTKTVGIRVVTKGNPAPGYWVRTVTTDPATVTLRGPREVIDSHSVLETAPVDVSGARAAIDTVVSLAVSRDVEVIGGDGKVRVQVDVAPLAGTKEVAASVSVTNVPDGLRVNSIAPPTLRLVVRGEGETFDHLRAEDVQVIVSAAGREQGSFTVTPSLESVRSPSGIRAVSIEHKDVTVTLESS